MIHRPKPRFLFSLLLTALLAAGGAFAQAAAVATDAQSIWTPASFDSAGVPIHYVTAGSGEPLILVHGFSATADANWILPGIAPQLAEQYRVIALDNRGHGKSGKPHDPAAYGDAMVQDVTRLMDHLGLDSAHVAGYSMGGFMTLRLLTTAPERVRSAIIGGAGWSGEEGLEGIDDLATALENGQGITPLIRALTPEGQPPMSDEQIQFMNQMVLANNDPLALAAVARGMAGLAVSREQVTAIETPVLAVIGSQDPLKVGVDAMQGLLPNLEVLVLDGADHMTATMSPVHANAFAERMLEFLGEGGKTPGPVRVTSER